MHPFLGMYDGRGDIAILLTTDTGDAGTSPHEKLIFYNWKLVLLFKSILFWLCLYLSGKWLHILCILFIRYNFIYMADETMAI